MPLSEELCPVRKPVKPPGLFSFMRFERQPHHWDRMPLDESELLVPPSRKGLYTGFKCRWCHGITFRTHEEASLLPIYSLEGAKL